MSSSFVVACVGKPSAGKSSFLNAVTDATAKVGNFPFTTIEPNQGIAYYPVDCPCKKYNRSDRCKPRHGWCKDGRRFVPIKLLDVAGLVPGASEGKGLGNQFLDDLRHADVLIHVVDASGTTDAGGKETKGYDPINDIQWLRSEVQSWIFNNLNKKWPGTVRRHQAVKASVVDTLHGQLAGYGVTKEVVQRTMDRFRVKTDISQWDQEQLVLFVQAFLDERFPTIVALNKIDMPDADKNIAAILKRYGNSGRGGGPLRDGVKGENVVLTSALGECFLRKMDKQGYIKYETGADDFATKDEDAGDELHLKPLDEKVRRRLENIRDLVLFRYGSTGVQDVIVRAVEVLGIVPVFPVKNLANFGASADGSSAAFQDCVLVRPGMTVREFARKLHNQLDRNYAGAETVGNIQLGEDDIIVAGKNNIIKFDTSGLPVE
ncbi:GTP-binding protein [Martensiomyces pterosporus]|nr:GTP-binding protein [Martensiomyces pterosporus]